MATPKLTKEQVHALTVNDVHKTLSRVMLADGFDFVVDFDKSHSNYVFDARTNTEILDAFSYFASWAVGHNHPKMKDPEFLEKVKRIGAENPSNSDIYTVEMAQFVATFERVLMPPEFKHVFYISGGALAVENAMKAAMDWKVRKNLAKGKPEKGGKIMHLRSAFHGRSGYTMSVTNTDPVKIMHFPKFDWPRIPNPACIFPLEGDNLARTIAAEQESLRLAESHLLVDGDDIAAILIETIQGEGGDNQFRKEYFQQLRALADKYDVMLICDEVQCGCGATGKTWAYQHYEGFVPDMVCFGKKTQVCGFMSTDRIDSVKDNVFSMCSRINSTWGGNLTDMVRATKIYEIIEEEKLVENSAVVGDYLHKKLLEIQAKYPKLISNSRGKGLMCAFDLPDAPLRNSFRQLCLKNKMLLLPCGVHSVRFRLALVATKEEVEFIIKIVDLVCAEMSK